MANFIKSYKELESAFRFKRKNPSYPEYQFKESGKLKFEGENGIFDQARNRFFNRLPLPEDDMEMVNHILNTIDNKKTTLEQYLNPGKTFISGQVPVESLPEQVATGEPATTMMGGAPSAPSSPRLPSMPNIPQNIPRVPTRITNQGGNSLIQGLGRAIGAGGRGLGSFGLKAVNGGLDRWQTFSSARNRLRTPPIRGAGGKIFWAFLGAFFLIMFFGGMLAGIGGPTTPTAETSSITPSNTIAANLAQCSFSGTSGNLKAGNPTLAEMVSDISAKVGIPGSVLMGILRIESSDKFVNKDPNYLANDYDATKSSEGAIGIAQFMPGTFDGKFAKYKNEIAQKFQKTSVVTTVQTPHSPGVNDGVMRITSIRDSIAMAAYMVRDDKDARSGSAKPWDEDAVRGVARTYYGACSYEGAAGSYCEDLAQSFNNCKAAILADTNQIGQIVQGIQNACTGAIVVKSNLSCLNSVNPPLPKIVDDKIRESTLAYGALQCVGYVKALASWVNEESLNDQGVANAYDYQGIPPQGYDFVPKTDNKDIMIGDIAIWNNAPYGHVAYVVKVNSSNLFLITEASWGPQGYVRMDRIIDKLSEPGFQGFARKKAIENKNE